MFNLSTRLKSILLFAILLVAFWIRIQSASGIPEGHFTGVDAYLYYFQAQHISEHGKLPERDMHRWLPVGRDNGQLLNLYSYVLAYTHKAVSAVFPNVTLYDVTVYMPVICFCMGLGALCLFLTRSFGRLSACLVGVLLATLPGAINRSTAGFGDRDAWCWMIGLLVVITYLASLQAETSRKRLFWTFISGFNRVSRGSVLGRFWRVLERYHHCGAVAVSHDRNRGRVRSLCTVGVLFRANTLSCFPCLSEWICFCGTPFRFCACATRCTSGYTRLPTSSPLESGKTPIVCPHPCPRINACQHSHCGRVCFGTTRHFCRDDRAVESKYPNANRW